MRAYYYEKEKTERDFYTDLASERRTADLHCDGIYCQLHGEVDGGDQGDLVHRQIKIGHQRQEEQRRKVVDDGLGDVAQIAGVNGMIVAFANGCKHRHPPLVSSGT